MTAAQKLEVHLLHIVLPGIPLNARERHEYLSRATQGERQKAYDRALTHSPSLLPNEIEAAQKWVQEGK